MNRWLNGLRFFAVLVVCGACLNANAELKLPALFGDHMVLQCDREVQVWGWANSGEKVAVALMGGSGAILSRGEAACDATGKWTVGLSAMKAGSSGRLHVSAGAGDLWVEDVVVGEVWLGSGQSNMDFQIGAPSFPKEILETARNEAAAMGNSIRFFNVSKTGSDAPQDDVKGRWQIVTPENVRSCSAIAWNFAHCLHGKLDRPVGMIIAAWGGTPVEAWISCETLNSTSVAPAVWARHESLLKEAPAALEKYKAELAAWKLANPTPEQQQQNRRQAPREPYSATHFKAPTRLYNGMIHGLAPFTIQGMLWYQGEENANRPAEYPELIRALLASWRAHWKTEFPFYYVELAGLGVPQSTPAAGGWAIMREAQAAVLLLPKTGVVTAADLGDSKDIHPHRKKEVGERLARLALSDLYGDSTLARSPQFLNYRVEGNKVRIQLDYAKGLRLREEVKLSGFAIRGEGGEWMWAQVQIEGAEILVWNEQIAAPVAVRYGWAGNPQLSVENEAGLPLRSFRTDVTTP